MLTLTQEEIAEVTGRQRKSAQREALLKIGIPFKERPDGSPLVLRAALEASQRTLCDNGDTADGMRADPLDDAINRITRLFAGDAGADCLNHAAVIGRARIMERLCGVYFLIDGDEIVYVGQSTNIHSRIAQHNDKKFDKFTFVECEQSALNMVESIFIHTYRPKLNLVRVAGYVAAPVSWEELKNTALAYHAAVSGRNQWPNET